MPEPAFPQPELKKPESIEAIPSEDVLSLPGSSVDAPTKPTEVDPMADTERDTSPDFELPSVREGDAPPFPPLQPAAPDTEPDVPPTSVEIPSVQEGETPPLSGPSIEKEEIPVSVNLSELEGPPTNRDLYANTERGEGLAIPLNLKPPEHELHAMKKEYETYGSGGPDSEEPLTEPLHPIPPVTPQEVSPDTGVASSGNPRLPPYAPSMRGGALGVWDRMRNIASGRKEAPAAPPSVIFGRQEEKKEPDYSKPPHAPSVLNPIESDEDRKEFGGEEEGRAEVA